MSDATHPPPRESPGKGRGRLIDFPGGGRGSSRRPENNLPLQLTSFVGREKELAEVEGLLVDGTRLLTLSGPGGSGKTRLALAVANDVVENFEDGAWWVELASLSDPDLVPQAVASVLSVREAPERQLIETLANHLRSKRMLLVLDNCEHLVGSCAALADVLLRACPNLQILATSREALGVSGESAWLVPPLVLPEAGQESPVEDLRRYAATRLFIERARAALSTFELTEQNAPGVVRLCHRLEGMPLAIELAAARVKVLSVEQISSRLEDSFGLLTGGSRTTMPHQRTLRATMDWSHDLLSEKEQVLFRRLSVFAGGFTLEAAEEVCSGEDLEREEVLDVLMHLVDKSLVLVGERGGQARYRLLETVRQYGGERLENRGEAEQVRERHAQHYLALVEGAEPELKGPQQGAWLDRLEEDHDNLRAAIRWALEQGETQLALRLTASAAHLRYPRGYLTEGRRQLEAALAGTGGPPAARAKALTEVGWFALEQSDYDQGQELLEVSLLMYRDLGDKYGVAHALECLVVAKTLLGDYGRATQLQEESLALYRELGHKWGIAMALTNLGILAQKQGHYERATTLHQESLELLRVVGDSFSIGYVLSLLGHESLMQSQLECSTALLDESQSLLRQLGDKPTLATTLRNLAETVFRQGDGTRAGAIYKESLMLAAEVGSKAGVAGCLEGLTQVALTHRQPARAARLWGAAEVLREAIGSHLSHFDRSHPDHEDIVAAARSRLGVAAWEAAWSEGRAMTIERAVEYALDDSPPPPARPASLPISGSAPAEAKAPPHLRIFALGSAQVEVRGRALNPSDFGYAKPKELLFYLLCHPRPTREQIGLALWPEASTSQLRGSFHEALRRLRKALGGARWVTYENRRYTFNRSLGGYFFDVEAFEQKLVEARRVREDSPAEAITHLKEAVGLYGGDFLEGFATEGEWALVRDQELRRSYQEALQDLGVLLFCEGSYSEAAEFYRKIIALDRYSEAAHRELMRCEAASGERGRALGHYGELVELLQKELGSTPAPETVVLYESVLRGEEV